MNLSRVIRQYVDLFDPEGPGYIPSTVLRQVLQTSLDQVPQCEVLDLLDQSELQEDKLISFEGILSSYYSP